MHRLAVAVLAICLSSGAARTDEAGVFDYYVMALSWSPNWCVLEGDARGSEQCDQPYGWILHGLWPQYESGWPDNCPTSHRAPSRAMTRDMSDIMGTPGLAWHQWNKHGTCTGLNATDYFALSRLAYDGVVRPEVFRKLDDPIRLPAAVVEQAFLRDNPDLSPDMLTVTCRDGYVQEVRICLTRSLDPRRCAADTRRDCTLSDALFTPVR